MGIHTVGYVAAIQKNEVDLRVRHSVMSKTLDLKKSSYRTGVQWDLFVWKNRAYNHLLICGLRIFGRKDKMLTVVVFEEKGWGWKGAFLLSSYLISFL